jgi:hypothetical protein
MSQTPENKKVTVVMNPLENFDDSFATPTNAQKKLINNLMEGKKIVPVDFSFESAKPLTNEEKFALNETREKVSDLAYEASRAKNKKFKNAVMSPLDKFDDSFGIPTLQDQKILSEVLGNVFKTNVTQVEAFKEISQDIENSVNTKPVKKLKF